MIATLTASEYAVPTLLLIGFAAVLAPLIADRSGRLHLPAVVLEIVFGIILGHSVLNLAHVNAVVQGLSDMGLTYLIFMAGFEMDLGRIKGRPLTLGVTGWLLSLGLAMLVAFALHADGLVIDTVITGLALTTTAIGTLLPILTDSGMLGSRFGSMIVGIGAVGEIGPIVAVAVLLTHKDPLVNGLLLVVFVAIAVSTALLATRSHPPRVVATLRRHLHSSSQLPVRVSVVLVLLLVYLALELHLDVLLGAFAAGIAIRLFTMGGDSEMIKSKLEAIGFGFLIPIFFVVTGIKFDLHSLLTNTGALVRLPIFLVLFLVVRGVPALILYRRDLDRRDLPTLALFSATGLPLIVVITSIGVSAGRMLPRTAAALVGAGMLSVLLFPMLGLARFERLHPGARREVAESASELPPDAL